MTALISELERAREGSRELDAKITALVERRTITHDDKGRMLGRADDPPHDICILYWPGGTDYPFVKRYTTSLDAVRSLSNWVLIRASDIAADGLALVELGDPSRSPSVEVTGIHADLILAWCIAALKAREQADETT